MVRCPHCKGRLRVGLFATESPPKNTFASTAPSGLLSSLVWFMRGNKPQPSEANIIVRSEIKTSPHQMLINQMQIPATESELRQLADVYIRLKRTWSRKSSTDGTSITQPKHNKIKDAFIALNFLNQVNSTQYELNDAGLRFLRHFAI